MSNTTEKRLRPASLAWPDGVAVPPPGFDDLADGNLSAGYAAPPSKSAPRRPAAKARVAKPRAAAKPVTQRAKPRRRGASSAPPAA